jgi:dTDP-glucose pyrophosphorylase
MKRWDQTLVYPDSTLSETIKVLDAAALQIVLVVDKDNRKLLGTVTDGDIRRALIKRLSMESPVHEIMSPNPKVAHEGWSKARLLAFMEQQRLLQMPIVDEDGILVGLETLHGLLEHPRQENPVFLMAGGYGTRLRPLTDTCPKPMLSIGDKPILEIILESFVNTGFYRFYISTHYMPEKIQDYFGDGSRWGVSIQYVHEEQALGTAGALGLLPHAEINSPMIMMNGDLLTNLNYLTLLDFHEEHGGSATMCVKEYEYQVPYGVIQSDGHRATEIVEKPIHSYHINAGIYLLTPELVRSVKQGQHIDMPTLLEQEIEAGRGVNLYPLNDYWLDIGRMDDLKRAKDEIGDYFEC